MKGAIVKTGDSYIHVGIVPTRSIAHLAPPDSMIHEIMPGLSFYAVGVFNYRDIIDLEPGNEHYRWKGEDNLFDILVQFPVDHYNIPNLYYVHRLYNSDPAVVRWAKGYHLNKTGIDAQWRRNKSHFDLRIDRNDGIREHIELTGRSIMPLPGFIWRFGPLKNLVRAFLMFEDEGKNYAFEGTMTFKRSYLGRSSLRVAGLYLPKPIVSLTFRIDDLSMDINTFLKLYHPCRYGEDQPAMTASSS